MKNQKIITELENIYPNPQCALAHQNPWQLLVATILSAQCTDKRVNLVTPALFKKFPNIQSFAGAKQSEMETAIKSTGFYRNKAKNIIACAQKLLNDFNGEIPQNIKDLVSLRGVGRKTASVILGTSFGKAEGVVVDTHVKRLSYRLGFSRETNPDKIEADLMKKLPRKKWIIFSHLLILHGRNRCKARKPDCDNCEILTLCPRLGVNHQ
ncbi:MAG: endonuclease III [Candidatus Rifleibacteriota bacterium]